MFVTKKKFDVMSAEHQLLSTAHQEALRNIRVRETQVAELSAELVALRAQHQQVCSTLHYINQVSNGGAAQPRAKKGRAA